MKRTYVKVEIQEDGSLKSVIHKVDCGATLLQLNGAGTKAALLHNSNHHAEGVNQSIISGVALKGHSKYNIDNNGTTYITTHKIGYEDRDKLAIGENSCNSYLFLSPGVRLS